MNKRALVIEDNENNMELMTFLLNCHGYRYTITFNGQDGIEAALSNPPDFILLDIQLPDMDGSVVLEKIRADQRGAEIPIIAVTSYAMSGDRERLIQKGCTGYIEKPINPETVVAEIERILGT